MNSYQPTGFQMINSIIINNFKCFEHLEINNCAQVNVIVGENGSGKTALLEAMFFALGHVPELGIRFRQQRGQEAAFKGSAQNIESAIWRDYFYERDWSKSISIETLGDGSESRHVTISRGNAQMSIPLSDDSSRDNEQRSQIKIAWKDVNGNERTSYPKVTKGGYEFEISDEDLPDFFLYPANQLPRAAESAGRFSDLRRSGKAKDFIAVFNKEYPWIEDISIELSAEQPDLYVKDKYTKELLPIGNISGGIRRMVSIMLGIAKAKSVVLIDEMENGIYHRNQTGLWRSIFSLVKEYDSQLFVTTHSAEFLESMAEAADDFTENIALWRIDRSKEGPKVLQFKGKKILDAIASGEVR